jgi:hypothetical protein
VVSGDRASFTVKATGGQLRYQWQRSADGGRTWVNLAGRTSPTLTVSARSAVTLYEYRAVVRNMVAKRTSTTAVLFVDSTLADPYPVGTAFIGAYWIQAVGPTTIEARSGTRFTRTELVACSLTDGGRALEDLDVGYRTTDGSIFWGAGSVVEEDGTGCGVYRFETSTAGVPEAGGVWVVDDWSGEGEIGGPVRQYVVGA